MFSQSKCLSSLCVPLPSSQHRDSKGKIALTSKNKIIKDSKSKILYLTIRYRLGFGFLFWLPLISGEGNRGIYCGPLFVGELVKRNIPYTVNPWTSNLIAGMLDVWSLCFLAYNLPYRHEVRNPNNKTWGMV